MNPNRDMMPTRIEVPMSHEERAERVAATNREARERQAVDARTQADILRRKDELESEAALARIRRELTPESELIRSKHALIIPMESLQETHTAINVEMSKRAGVLGTGESGEHTTGSSLEGRTVGGDFESTTSFQGVAETPADQRGERMSIGVSMKGLRRQDAINRLKRLGEEAAQAKAAHGQLRQISDEDVEAAFGGISRPETPKAPDQKLS
ncbi:MAG TPA: hypothetical protein VN397_04080 [Candidatus Methylomirabilis sp.]|nr:hypothetical protein [Candidatus Methylomirabilis sp.]